MRPLKNSVQKCALIQPCLDQSAFLVYRNAVANLLCGSFLRSRYRSGLKEIGQSHLTGEQLVQRDTQEHGKAE